MRLDKLLCEMNFGSRKEVKELLKKGDICISDIPSPKADDKVDESTVTIRYQGRIYHYQKYVYFMMNKPAGIITATEDSHQKTVLDLLKEDILADRGSLIGIPVADISPVGRLDKDTVGLLLLTNDGGLAHRLLSPTKHVEKCYYVETDHPIKEQHLLLLASGVDIGEDKLTAPAKAELCSANACKLTITEGKFHQVKRMFQAVGLTVVYLKRLSMGPLVLDESMPEGAVRELTEDEVTLLC